MDKYQLNLTYKCNQNCIFCSVLKHPKPDPPFEEITTMIDLIKEPSEIIISGGEPTTKTNLLEVVKYIVSKGHKVSMETNCFALLKNLNQLFNVGLSKMQLSIHGSKETHNNLVKDPKSFDKIVEVLNVLEKQTTNKILVNTNTVIVKENITELLNTAIFLSKYDCINSIKMSYPRFYPIHDIKEQILSLDKVKPTIIQLSSIPKVVFENIPYCIFPHTDKVTSNIKILTCGNIWDNMDNRIYWRFCGSCKDLDKCVGGHAFYQYYFKRLNHW